MSWIAKCRGQNAYRQVSWKNKTKLEEASLKQTLTELLSSIPSQIQTHKNTLLFTFPKQPIPTRVCLNFAVSQAENWSQHKSCWAAAFCCTIYSKLRWNYDACSATLTLICCHLLLLAFDSDACCAPLTLKACLFFLPWQMSDHREKNFPMLLQQSHTKNAWSVGSDTCTWNWSRIWVLQFALETERQTSIEYLCLPEKLWESTTIYLHIFSSVYDPQCLETHTNKQGTKAADDTNIERKIE